MKDFHRELVEDNPVEARFLWTWGMDPLQKNCEIVERSGKGNWKKISDRSLIFLLEN